MKNWQPLAITSILVFTILVFVSDCAPTNKLILKIDPSRVVAVQDMRTEVTAILEDLGYQWHPIFNDLTGQKLKVAKKYGQYRMLFKPVDDKLLTIWLVKTVFEANEQTSLINKISPLSSPTRGDVLVGWLIYYKYEDALA